MVITKQSVGIDVGKDEFYARILRQAKDEPGFHKHRGNRKFPNTAAGFRHFQLWLGKYVDHNVTLTIAMEATGVYHEALAYFLHENGYRVAIELPTKIKAFAKSLNQQSKTDLVDAEVIAQLAIERELRAWVPPTRSMRQLKSLTRQAQAITEARTVAKNQLHAATHSAYALKTILKRYQQIIALYDKQIETIEREIQRLRTQDRSLDELLELLVSIPGVGLKTAAVITAETGGFQLFEARNQLVKYAGMDIKEKQSGTSIRGKSKMSKVGNARIRRALHMPSLQYINDDGVFGKLYQRVLARTGIKLKALVAVQRKLLIVMYAVIKNRMPYDPELHQKRALNRVGEPESAYCDSVS
jgi:transposase